MKKYISFFTFILFFSCSEKKNEFITFDASRDTTFIIERSSGNPTIVFSIKGFITDSVTIFINNHGTKYYDNQRLVIKLDSGKVNIINERSDFYADEALFTFKHLNNKKGKLTIKASL